MVKITAEMYDDNNIRWSSWGIFSSNKKGMIDFSQQAPLRGTYSQCDPMGLLWSMQADDVTYSCSINRDAFTILFRVFRSNQEIASKNITRQMKAPTVQRIPVRENGLIGTLFLPSSKFPLPTIIVLNGSDGGIGETRSQLLASHGFAILALGYFGMDGLPPVLENIPLEYFEQAFTWIRSHPNLNAAKVGLYGISKGAELSLLIGSVFPDAIQAIAASVPSSVLTGGEGASPDDHAWIYQNEPLAPFVPQVEVNDAKDRIARFLEGSGLSATSPATLLKSYTEGLKNRSRRIAASIPVEKMKASILVFSGGHDSIWPSTQHCVFITERLKANNSPVHFEHIHYPFAGHSILAPLIPQPSSVNYDPICKKWFMSGGTVQDNWNARHDSWKRLLAFFKKTLSSRK